MVRPARSSSRNFSQVAHFGTRFELAIRTRGASRWVRSTPTGFPLCTSSVSSSPSWRSDAQMRSSEAQSGQPAFYVPAALQKMGLSIVPVPVYFPAVQEILGEKVYRKLSEVPGEIDIVDVFRRPSDVAQHLPDLLAKHPRAVWLQSGIRDDRTAESLARSGILVVQDRCLMVDYRSLHRRD